MSSNDENPSLTDTSDLASLYLQLKDSKAKMAELNKQKPKHVLDYWNSKNIRIEASNEVKHDGSLPQRRATALWEINDAVSIVFKASMAEVENETDSLRNKISMCWRLKGEPLNLLKFPVEVFTAILGFIKEPQLLKPPATTCYELDADMKLRSKDCALSVKTIQNLRLTCRKANILCSPFLLHFLRVEMTLKSLTRLQMVSSHPLISRGIKSVRFMIHYYDPFLAKGYKRFCREKRNCLMILESFESVPMRDRESALEAEAARALENERALEDGGAAEDKSALEDGTALGGESASDNEEDSDNEEYWNDKVDLEYPDDDEDSEEEEEDSGENELYKKAYDLYVRLYQEQEDMIANGTFLRVVASSIARMPHAKSLQIHDRDPAYINYRRYYLASRLYHKLPKHEGKEECFMEDMVGLEFATKHSHVHPGYSKSQCWVSPYNRMMIHLPIAISKTGHVIESLRVQALVPRTFNTGAPQRKLQQLSAAMKNLKRFTFYCASLGPKRDKCEWPPTGLGGLIGYISSVLNTDYLEKIDINLAYLAIDGEIRRIDNAGDCIQVAESLGPILTKRTWPLLKSVHLTKVPVHLHELQGFLNGLKSPLSHLELGKVFLVSGRWKNAIEVLQRASIRTLRLGQPFTEEWDWESRIVMSRGEITTGLGWEKMRLESGGRFPSRDRARFNERSQEEDAWKVAHATKDTRLVREAAAKGRKWEGSDGKSAQAHVSELYFLAFNLENRGF
ncbi:hypothetical protein DSL72_000290 [Monilinia vaccinii-corymbosi]|uniref:Uncharacterized protein n=1 Tax=Monilinia vaccinii-corymbosi TaxID=61207 RepID=A0A8A3P184_9HELO|nr:hypothetical protein DSL72_000290 [Monilinia vaccinii-corymbosi]